MTYPNRYQRGRRTIRPLCPKCNQFMSILYARDINNSIVALAGVFYCRKDDYFIKRIVLRGSKMPEEFTELMITT